MYAGKREPAPLYIPELAIMYLRMEFLMWLTPGFCFSDEEQNCA